MQDNDLPQIGTPMQTDETRAREVLGATKHADDCAMLTALHTDYCDCDRAIRAMLAFAAPPAVEREMPADDEIRLLREALTIYGDRVRMATSCRPDLQQVIDYAFEHTQDRPAFGGDSETRPTLHPSDREAIARTFLAVWYDWHGEARPWWDALDGAARSRALRSTDAILALSGSLAPEGGSDEPERMVSGDLAARLDPAPDMQPIGRPKLWQRRSGRPSTEKGGTK